MTRTDMITKEYTTFIGGEVVGEFGGSYQNFQTLGSVWRQKLGYSKSIEDFIMVKTRLYLRLLSDKDTNNFNMMYKVCFNIADYLSKYLAKKSPDITRKNAADEVLNKIYFNSPLFVNKFKKVYKRPVDESNPHYVAANTGIIAMSRHLKNRQR